MESRDILCADAEGNAQLNDSSCDTERLPERLQECEDQTEEVSHLTN